MPEIETYICIQGREKGEDWYKKGGWVVKPERMADVVMPSVCATRMEVGMSAMIDYCSPDAID